MPAPYPLEKLVAKRCEAHTGFNLGVLRTIDSQKRYLGKIRRPE
jgi:hypothetical protein